MTDRPNRRITRREVSAALAKGLGAGLVCSAAGQTPRAAAAPATKGKAPQPGKDAPRYRIYPLPNGRCKIAGNHAFEGGDETETYEYMLFVWLILGGDKPILVDAGLNDVAEMNRGAAKVLREPITQRPDETVKAQLRKFGLTPDDIGHVFVTHLHFDHVDGLTDFKNARIYIGRKEWELATANDCRGSWGHGRIMFTLRDEPGWNKRLVLVEDEEVLPGLESFFVGGHTLGSMAYRVNTAHGKVVLTGDTVSLLANIEKDIPVGVRMNLEDCITGMKKIRERADVVLPSHDPGTLDRWPPVAKGTPRYTIRAIKVGQCEVRNHITFHNRPGDQGTRTFYLYVWVIQGGRKPIVVETGPNPKYVDEFNRATAKYIPGGIKQLPEENTVVALKRHGIDPADVSHVIVTHLHGDHYDYFPAFPSARFVVNKTEFADGFHALKPDVLEAIRSRPGVLQLVEDEEIMPGIRTVPLGCHTNGSQGILVQTHMGPAILCGDVVYIYDNIEQNRATHSPNEQACLDAMVKLRSLADLILPAHDPLTLERWPGGVIGGKPSQ